MSNITAKFITFYSFKGGVGRSMALINTAAILAGKGFKVLAIDLDLEAPGISYLSINNERDESGNELNGFVDLMLDAKKNGIDSDLFSKNSAYIAEKYTRLFDLPKINPEFPDGSLSIMPAGRLNEGYSDRFNTLNLNDLYAQGLGEPLIRAFKEKLANSALYDYIFVDSRTGFSDEAGICTRDLADHLLVLSGLNRQNVEGTSEFLRALRGSSEKKRSLQIVLSPVPNGEDALTESREKAADQAFEKAWGERLDLSLQIPYHPQLALTEEPHIFRRKKGQLFEAYSNVEQSMLSVIGQDILHLRSKIRNAISQAKFLDAIAHVRFLVRLDRGKSVLAHIIFQLAKQVEVVNKKTESETSQRRQTLDSILRDDNGKEFIRYSMNYLPIDDEAFDIDTLLTVLEKNHTDLADNLHHRIANSDPPNAQAMCEYANFLSDQKSDFDLAEEYYRKAIEADSEDARIFNSYAVFLTTQRVDFAAAEQNYKKAIELDNDILALSNYASFLADIPGRSAEAENYYKTAISEDPSDPGILLQYADYLISYKKNNDFAEEVFKSAIEIAPNDIQSHIAYAQFLYHKRNDLEKANAQFSSLLKSDPENADVLASVADFTFSGKKDPERAKYFYESALKNSPNNARINLAYANFLKETKEFEKALIYYENASTKDPKNYFYHFAYAAALDSTFGKKDLAEEVYRKSLAIKPNDAVVMAALTAHLHRKNGDSPGLLQNYETALNIEPDDAFVLNSFANYLSNKDPERAKELFLRAIENDPESPSYFTDYADFLTGSGETLELAKEYYERSLLIDSKNPRTKCNFAQFLIGQGELDSAETILVELIEQNDLWNSAQLEIHVALWVITRIKDSPSQRHLDFIKENLGLTNEKDSWRFDCVLSRAKASLSERDFIFIQSITDCIRGLCSISDIKNHEP
jgi:Tfp pilus assembly protein PilF/cellulose biosynthesis protein BcsQ